MPPCDPDHFRCGYGLVSDTDGAGKLHDRTCIPSKYRCDGEHDCEDGSDEAYKNRDLCWRGMGSDNLKCILNPDEQLHFCGGLLIH